MKHNMGCNCCGGLAGRFEQHFNRDTGFGMCRPCIEWVRKRGMSEAEILDLYGREGIHWATAEQWAEIERGA